VQIDGGVIAPIDGGVIFKLIVSSNSIIVLSNFSYDRAFPLELTPDQQQNNIVYWEIGAVPWVPILNLFDLCYLRYYRSCSIIGCADFLSIVH